MSGPRDQHARGALRGSVEWRAPSWCSVPHPTQVEGAEPAFPSPVMHPPHPPHPTHRLLSHTPAFIPQTSFDYKHTALECL